MGIGNLTEMTRKMIEKSQQREDTGFEPEDFGRDYWLEAPLTGLSTRIDKSGNQVVVYWKALFGDLPSGSILDVGAGTGRSVSDMRKAGLDAYGCEFSPSGRELAKERFELDLDFCDLRARLPYEDNQFAWSMCIGVLSMIPKQFLPSAISEILRVTQFGTLLLVMTHIDKQQNINPHHLTSMTSLEYWRVLKESGAFDWTAIQPPPRRPFGIGVLSGEFSGLFSKLDRPI